MRGFVLVAIALGCAVAASAQADTVHFKDGSSLDGVVTRPNDNSVAVEVGGGRMVFPATDVESVETNDKQGSYSVNEIRARHHNDMMLERTGLTREQRDKVRGIVAMLETDDPVARENARNDLKALAGEMPIYKYLDSCLPYTRGQRVAEVMQVMAELDPESAKDMLMNRAQDPNPVNRAKSLELMAQVMKEEGLERIAQGMVDTDSQIQIASAEAMAAVGDKGASLVLLEGLKSEDERVRNASKLALSRLWTTENGVVEFNSTEEWQSYLDGQRGQMPKAIDPATLKPLIQPEEGEEAVVYVDE